MRAKPTPDPSTRRVLTLTCHDGHPYTTLVYDEVLESAAVAAYRLGAKAARIAQAIGDRGFPVCQECGHRDFTIKGLPRAQGPGHPDDQGSPSGSGGPGEAGSHG